MAKDVTFSGISKVDRSEALSIRPPGWDADEIMRKTSFKWTRTNETGSYVDDDADINLDDARLLHVHFRPGLLEKIVYNTECREAERKRTDEYASKRFEDYKKYVEELELALNTLDSALGKNANDFSHFHLTISEWESGY